MSSCCSKPPVDDTIENQTTSSCCGSSSMESTTADTGVAAQAGCCSSASSGSSPSPSSTATSACCDDSSKPDWFLRTCFILVLFFYSLNFNGWIETIGVDVGFVWQLSPALTVITETVYELVNTMWFSVIIAALFVGFLAKIPQQFVVSILGQGGSFRGLCRATMAGVLMDLCSHGILMVGMQLYRKGASLGQVIAFLVASPWNSLSLTLILFALIGWQWTLAFIGLSMLLALTTGYMFDRLTERGVLPGNPMAADVDEDFQFWPEAKRRWQATEVNKQWLQEVFDEAVSGSKMVVRWLLFGVLLAAAIRGFVALEDFQNYFGPSMIGLGATLLAATIIEVCSEGSTPIAADLMTRANAPGNSFAFLMTGVATDYTEVMVIKDTMKSWKVALFLPLLCVPQVIAVAVVLNQMG